MKKILVAILVSVVLFCSSPADALNKMWWATGRTGGGDALDGIAAATLTVGDGCIVVMEVATTDPRLYIYRLYDSGTAEADPTVIAPNDAAGGTANYRWHLVNLYGNSANMTASDGNNRLTITNNTTRAPTASAMEIYPEGSIWKLNNNGTEYTIPGAPATVTTNQLMKFSTASGTPAVASTIVEDGTDINIQALNLVGTGAVGGVAKVLTITTGLTIGSAPATVGTDRVVYGGAIFATTTATIVLPAVVIGASVCIYSQAAVVLTVDPNASDGIRNGTATRNADGHQITCDAVAGNFVCLIGDSADGWTVMGKAGTWTDE